MEKKGQHKKNKKNHASKKWVNSWKQKIENQQSVESENNVLEQGKKWTILFSFYSARDLCARPKTGNICQYFQTSFYIV